MGLSKPKNIINNIVDGGGLEMELLWENASPTSQFGAQTINVDSSGYDAVFVRTKKYTTQSIVISSGFVKHGEVGYISSAHPDSTNTYVGQREFTVNEKSIIFTVALEAKGSAKGSESNNMFVPIEIYGIKGVKTV